MKTITVQALVNAPPEKVWQLWTAPEHINQWNNSSDDWYTPLSENDLRVGGKFFFRMEAKDGSSGFDFAGVYDEIKKDGLIAYTIGDGRKVKVTFTKIGDAETKVVETFEAESANPLEMQHDGWQAILDNFRKYAEAQHWMERLEQEGFTNVRVCPIPPNQESPEHTHDEHTVHVILNGELTIIDADGVRNFRPGDRIEFPAGTTHKARGLTDNGNMVVGVKISTPSIQKIMPHFWFDKEAVAAVEFYNSVFEDSKITHKSVMRDTPSGDCDIVGFQIMGYDFMAMSAGPLFKINPSISFHVKCRTVEEVDALWEKLSSEGKVLMELGEYPFSKRYGWIQDKYGVSWQVIYAEMESKQKITPVLMFTGDVCGKAEEAADFYATTFPNSKSQVFARYSKDEEPDKEGTVKYAQLILEGLEFGVMDSAQDHKFKFNEAVSLILNCKDQKEIDYYWSKLSAVPEAEQCGWVKDKFGVSWQIIPENMVELMSRNPEKTTSAMLKMGKIIVTDLEKAGNKNENNDL